MSRILMIFLMLFGITRAGYSYAQTNEQEQVYSRYLENGAWKHHLFSREWGCCIDSALNILPHDASLWQQRAMPFFKQKKYQVGMRYLDSAVKYDKEKEYIAYRGFIKCIFQKDYVEATADFNAALALNGNSGIMDHSYKFYIALCYLQLNSFDTAGYMFKECVNATEKKLGPSWVHYMELFYLGVVLYEQQHYSEAITVFDRCIGIYTNFSDALYYKALCLLYLKDRNAAHVLLEHAQDCLKQGYTINEDNSIYEAYPYQVNKYMIQYYLDVAG